MSAFVDIKKKLPGFTLEVQFETENEIMALLGASGCGKSMTLKCIAGIVKPDEGRIELDGVVLFDSRKRINLTPQQRRVGLLFQNYALFPNMTVEQNICTGMRRYGKIQDKSTRIREILEIFRLTEQRGHYPSQLSGGQQQRTALARIFAGEPRMIMLDEPLSALDSFLRWRLEQELAESLDRYRGPVVYVSHNKGEVYRVCRRVCVMNNGKSELVTSVDEMYRAPKTLSSAKLSGCENFSRAVKTGESAVYAQDWNHTVTCGRVSEDVRYIGIRAQCVYLSKGENSLPCIVTRITDDVFSTIVTLLPENTDSLSDFSQIRMELPQKKAEGIRRGDLLYVEFSEPDIMLLK